jgi:putative membrane protein
MKSMLVPALMLATTIGLATAGCSKNDTSSETDATATEAPSMDTSATPAATDTAAVASSQAAQFLTDAMKGDNSEVKLGKLAQDMGSSQGVKDFGKMLENDHGKAKDQVAQVAKAMNVPTTDEMMPEADAEYTKLQGMSGAAFDKEFASYMVDDHKKDIDKFQKEANSSDPTQVTDLAKQTLPTLQKHLKTAQSLNK